MNSASMAEQFTAGFLPGGFGIGTWTWHIRGRTVRWSPEQCAIFGVPPFSHCESSVEGFSRFVHEEDRARVMATVSETLAQKREGHEQRFRIVRPDGTVRHILSRASLELDSKGEPAILSGIDIDLTGEESEAVQANERLREEQRFTQSIIEAGPTITYIYDILGQRNTFVSTQCSDIIGYTPAEISGMGSNLLANLMHPNDLPRAAAKFEEIRQAKADEIFEFEYRMRHKDGSWVWMLSRDRVFKRDAAGMPVCILGVAANISEHKQAEEILRASENFNRTVLEASPDCLKVLDAQGHLQFMNANGCEIMEIDDFAPQCGHDWRSFWPQPGQALVDEALAKARRGEASRFEAFCPTAKGNPRWWDVAVMPSLDGKGQLSRIIATSRDISERKAAEIALRESEEFNRSTLQSLPGQIAVIDRQGRIVAVNQAWTDFACANAIKEPSSVGVGASYLAVCREAAVRDADAAAALAGIEAVLKGETPQFSMEYPCHSPRERCWFLMIVMPIQGASRGGAVISHFNITERKRAEEAVAASEQRYRSAFETAAASLWEEDFSAVKELIDGLKQQGVNDFTGYFNAHPETVTEAAGLMRVLDVNQQTLRLFEADSKEQLLASLPSIFTEDTWLAFRAELVAIAEGPRAFSFETTIRTLHGNIRNIILSVHFPEGSESFDNIVIGVADISERKRYEEQQKLLLNELNHRVKNTLATVQGLASQTLRNTGDLKEARESFTARLLSLAKAHDILTSESWESAPLMDIVERAIAAYRGGYGSRITVEGPPVRVNPKFTLALSLALHELCTNAVKYGALSNDKGKVVIAWDIESGKKAPQLIFHWRETGGPPVKPPTRQGFGSRLIQRGLASDLGGEVEIDFARKGVTCTITAPLPLAGGQSSDDR